MCAKAYDKKTAAFAGFIIQNIPELDDDTMNRWMENPEATKRFLAGLTPVLEPITTVELAGIESFIANDKFCEGKTIDGVRIAWLGPNFKRVLLGKTERGIAQATLRVQKLRAGSLDVPILTELGDTATIALAQVWEILKKKGAGQSRHLLVSGASNIAYIFDDEGNLWAVGAYWLTARDGWDAADVGWNIEANSVGYPIGWDGGDQVVSR